MAAAAISSIRSNSVRVISADTQLSIPEFLHEEDKSEGDFDLEMMMLDGCDRRNLKACLSICEQ